MLNSLDGHAERAAAARAERGWSSGSRSSSGVVGRVDAAVVAAPLVAGGRRAVGDVRAAVRLRQHVDLDEELPVAVLEVELGERAGGVSAEAVQDRLVVGDIVALLELGCGLVEIRVVPGREEHDREPEHPGPTLGGGTERRLTRRHLELTQELGPDITAAAVIPCARDATDARAHAAGPLVDADAGSTRDQAAAVAAPCVAPPAVVGLDD